MKVLGFSLSRLILRLMMNFFRVIKGWKVKVNWMHIFECDLFVFVSLKLNKRFI